MSGRVLRINARDRCPFMLCGEGDEQEKETA